MTLRSRVRRILGLEQSRICESIVVAREIPTDLREAVRAAGIHDEAAMKNAAASAQQAGLRIVDTMTTTNRPRTELDAALLNIASWGGQGAFFFGVDDPTSGIPDVTTFVEDLPSLDGAMDRLNALARQAGLDHCR